MAEAKTPSATRARPSARRAAPPGPHHPADDLGPTHDPGPDAAQARLVDERVEAAASEPLELTGGHKVRIGTASWTDPTMTAAGVFYPSDADTAEERLGLLRVPLPGRRGRRDVLRAPLAPAVRAVGRADPAGLRVRHQGPRPAHRAADRDQAAAEGAARGPAGDPRREAAPVRQGPAGRAPRRGLADLRGGPRAARRERPARRGVPAVPEVVLHLVREPRRDPRGEGRAGAATG